MPQFLVPHDDLSPSQLDRLKMIMADSYANECLPEVIKDRIRDRFVSEGLEDTANLSDDSIIRRGEIVEQELARFVKDWL